MYMQPRYVLVVRSGHKDTVYNTHLVESLVSKVFVEVVELQHSSHNASIQPYITRLLISATPFWIGASFSHNIDLELRGWTKEEEKMKEGWMDYESREDMCEDKKKEVYSFVSKCSRGRKNGL